MSDRQRNFESCSGIESMILAAGSYVGPSDDLRPRTMEAAREQSSAKATRQTLKFAILAAGVLIMLSTALYRQASKLPVPVGLSAHEVERRAAQRAGSGIPMHWAMVEIFSELRENWDGSPE